MSPLLSCAVAAAVALLVGVAEASAAVVSFDHPAMDLWMYENAPDNGSRENAPIFGGPVGTGNGSDDRMAQFVMGWNTAAAGIPAGLAAAQYQITRVTLRATQVNENVFVYDSSYDGFRTYRDQTDPLYISDGDAGRPVEVYGVGLRNGYTQLAVSGSVSGTRFGEASNSFGSGAGEHTRHAFAYSPASPRADRDVSENVSEGFEAVPFAIGITQAVAEGEYVPEDTEFTFELNLADPGILAYIKSALASGQLGLTLSAMHGASFGGGQPGAQSYPRFYTRDYYDYIPEVAPKLEIEFAIVPEPSAGRVLVLAGSLIVTARAWRRRDRYS